MYNSIKRYFSTMEAENGCYPTPPELASQLLTGLNWRQINTVLEPSAGLGNLIEAVIEYGDLSYHRNSSSPLDLDYIEYDPHLQAILKYKFQGGQKAALIEQLRSVQESVDPSQKLLYHSQERKLRRKIDGLNGLSAHLVQSDFLQYDTDKHYDLIVMNPPFATGEQHLLKAIEMQKKSGGMIRCILGANSLKQPNTKLKSVLAQELELLGAEIEYKQGMFMTAERETDCEIAVIKISIPEPERKSEFFERMKAAAYQADISDSTKALVPHEFITQMIQRFMVESKAGLDLIREYKALRPLILSSTDKDDKYAQPLIQLNVRDENYLSENAFLFQVRKKYWKGLFDSPIITSRLTSALVL